MAIGQTATDVVDYRDGNEPGPLRKLSGITKYGNITLKWGVEDSMNMEQWHEAIAAGQIQSNRKNSAVIFMDEAGSDKARFVMSEAWPSKYIVTGLNGKGNKVWVDSIELVQEGVEREQ